MALIKTPSPAMTELLRRCADGDYNVALASQRELAKALVLPLKQGVIKGDIVGPIFSTIKFEPGQAVEFPLDFLVPGTEGNYMAYVVPNHGRIQERSIEGDYLAVPTYNLGNSIDWPLRYLRDSRWDIVSRAIQVLESGHVMKRNSDGFRVILSGAYSRNIVVYDDAAPSGLFSKRLVNLMQISMRRNGGGNSSSVNRGKLTDLYLSPESLGDVRSWDLTQIDEVTRREIFVSTDDVTKIFGTTIHALDELGVNQEFQNYFKNTLGGTLPTDKVEFVFGLDLSKDDSFLHPVRDELNIWEDPTMHRQNRAGLYSREEIGFSLLDQRRVIAGAL